LKTALRGRFCLERPLLPVI